MAYQITYGPVKQKKEKPRSYNWRVSVLVFAAVLVISTLVAVYREELIFLLLPGDPRVTAAALDNMAEQIGEGQRIADAFTCFCQEIIDHADFTP